MSNGVNFPQEIIVDILSRLPAKSLCRFKCVSNPWRALISHPRFVKMHFDKHKNHQRVIVISQSGSPFCIGFEESPGNEATATEVDFRSVGLTTEWVEVRGSCDGLLLVVDKENSHFLLNPSTRVYKKLPPSPYEFSSFSPTILYGLGYDSSTDDYKVIRISHFEYMIDDDAIDASFYNTGWVYSLKNPSWKRVQDSPYDHRFSTSRGAFVNGSLHWIAENTPSDRSELGSWVMVAFRLADENFHEVPLPSSLPANPSINHYRIFNLGGCLSILYCDRKGKLDIWVMKEYGSRDSWTESNVVIPNVSGFSRVSHLCELRNGEIVLVMDREKLVVYNPKEETVRDVLVHGNIPNVFRNWGSYVQSLISPKSSSGIEASVQGLFLDD